MIPVEPEELPSLAKRLFRGAGKDDFWNLCINPTVEIFIFECFYGFDVTNLRYLQVAWS